LTLTNKTLVETLEAMEHKDVILVSDYTPKNTQKYGFKCVWATPIFILEKYKLG
jgi:hypothetical protein